MVRGMNVFAIVVACLLLVWCEGFSVQLVKPSKDHKNLELNQKGIEQFLASQRSENGMDVVAVVGPYHSGKSFLINNLIISNHKNLEVPGKDGMPVGMSVDSTTMGIHAWIIPQLNTVHPGLPDILFLDSEGFGGKNVSAEYDSKIFAVSTLLSSHLLYNGLKNIVAQDVDALETFAHKTRMFHLKATQDTKGDSSGDGGKPVFGFPPITWAVQDFSLALRNGQNATDYVLEMVHGKRKVDSSDEGEEGIGSLAALFPAMHGFLLPSPTERAKDLKNLDSIEHRSLDEEYKEATKALRVHLQQQLYEAALLRYAVTRANQQIAGSTQASLPMAQDGTVKAVSNEVSSTTFDKASHHHGAISQALHEHALAVNSIGKKMVSKSNPKSAERIVQLLRMLVDAANRGLMPKMPNTWAAINELQAREAKRASYDEAKSHLSLLHNSNDPKPSKLFNSLAEERIDYARNMFGQLRLGLTGQIVIEQAKALNETLVVLLADEKEANKKQVKKYLDDEASRYKKEWTDFLQIEATSIPRASGDYTTEGLKQVLHKKLDRILGAFKAKTADKYSQDETKSSVEELHDYLETRRDQLISKNKQSLEAVLEAAKKEAKHEFNLFSTSAMNEVGESEPLTSVALESIKTTAQTRSEDVFQRKATKAKTEGLYTTYSESLASANTADWSSFVIKNGERLKKKVQLFVSAQQEKIQQDYVLMQKPADEASLKKFKSERRAFVDKLYAETFARFNTLIEIRVNGKQSIDKLFLDLNKELDDMNSKAVEKLLPIKEILDIVKAEAKSHWITLTLKQAARNIARERIEERKKSGNINSKITNSQIEQAINSFLSGTEMQEQFRKLETMTNIIYGLAIFVVIFLLALISGKFNY